jgi:hypothetical protein
LGDLASTAVPVTPDGSLTAQRTVICSPAFTTLGVTPRKVIAGLATSTGEIVVVMVVVVVEVTVVAEPRRIIIGHRAFYDGRYRLTRISTISVNS